MRKPPPLARRPRGSLVVRRPVLLQSGSSIPHPRRSHYARTERSHQMIPEQALKAGAYAMFKRSIETLPPEKQALYGSWYEHNEAGANEEFEIAAGIIIQAALPHIETAIRKQIAADIERRKRDLAEGYADMAKAMLEAGMEEAARIAEGTTK